MQPGPLADLRVLELAGILAGPLVGQFCAELGAEVIKVEPPGRGDPTRGWFLSEESPDASVSAYFASANWGKKSIAIDLRTEEGIALVQRMAAASDVVIVSFKPGAARRFRLDHATLAARHPELIYVQVTAYGEEDPRPGFDAIIQAESGFTYLNGEATGGPVKMPVALMDILTAHQLKEGLLLALLQRQRGGAGGKVSASLIGSAVASLANQASNYLFAGVAPHRLGSEHPNIVPYGTIFTSRDGRELVLAVGTQGQFEALTEALGVAPLARDPRFRDNGARVRHRQALLAELAGCFSKRPADELDRILRAARVPFGFVRDLPAVFQDPCCRAQLLAGSEGVLTTAFGGTHGPRRDLSRPPGLDQHRDEVLAWVNGLPPRAE